MDNVRPVVKAILKLLKIALKISCYALHIALAFADESPSKSRRGSFDKGEAYGLLHQGRIGTAEFMERTKD